MTILSNTIQSRYLLFARIAAVGVLIVSILILVGWATGNYDLTRLIPSFNGALPFAGKIHSAAAVNLVLISIALLFATFDNTAFKRTGQVIAGIVLLVACFSAYDSLTGESFDSIRLFAPDPAAPGITYPTPVVPEVAITLALIGGQILLLDTKFKETLTFSQLLGLMALVVPLLILLGTAAQSAELCGLGGCIKTSIAFALISISLIFSVIFTRPEAGWMHLLSSVSMAGALTRRAALLVFAVPVLFVVRTVLTHIEFRGMPLLTESLSWPVLVVALLALVGYVVLTGAKSLESLEKEKSEISSILQETESMHQQVADKLAKTEQELSRTKDTVGTMASTMPQRFKRVCMICTSEYSDTVEICPTDGAPLSRVPDDSLEGTTFMNKYDIRSALGEGGMSIVYRARHRLLDTEVAIKVLKDGSASSGDGLKRFHREAKATSQLKHDGIVGVHDFGLAPDGKAFLVMDFLEGESLDDMVRHSKKLELTVVNHIVDQVCVALAHAHSNGIVHRDLKPGNIMITKNSQGLNQSKIVDFGLAKMLYDEKAQAQKLTQTGECFGSPLYMSPEQCTGRSLDHRTDIYAMGSIIYFCLTGDNPIMGKSVIETLKMQVASPPEPFPDDIRVPEATKQVVMKALSKKPKDRHQTALELRKEFMASAAMAQQKP